MLSMEVLKYIWTHPANRDQRVRAVARAVGWQLKKRLTGRSCEVQVFGGLRLRCYPDSRGAGIMLYTRGLYDHDEMNFVRRYLRPGDGVVDVGANIGAYTLLAASILGREGRIVAFEPSPKAAARLKENVEINGLQNVQVHCVAVSETPGTVLFYRNQDNVNRIVVDGSREELQDETDLVTCVTLDDELANARFEFGKIDIEGAELMAFRGGQNVLRQGNPPVWLVELKDRLLSKYGGSANELADLLRTCGFELGTYDADLGRLSFCDRPWQDHGNVLAIHRSALDRVHSRLTAMTPS